MKLNRGKIILIDTSNNFMILSYIVDGVVKDFFKEESNNDLVKKSIPFFRDFIKKNKIDLNEVKNYILVVGPGSFTGVKIGYNIISSISLIYEVEKIITISSFVFQSIKKEKYSVLKVGKHKFIYLNMNPKWYKRTPKPKITTNLLELEPYSIQKFYENVSIDNVEYIISNSRVINGVLSRMKEVELLYAEF